MKHLRRWRQSAGLMIHLAMDGYCREGDLLALRVADVVVAPAGAVLFFCSAVARRDCQDGAGAGGPVGLPYSRGLLIQWVANRWAKDDIFLISAAVCQKWCWCAAGK